MPKIWIDVEDDSGTRYGDGPITDVLSWRTVRNLDRAGSFVLRIPAMSPRASLLQAKRIVRCYAVVDSGQVEVGSGVIDSIVLRGVGQNAILEVSGGDLMRELSRVIVNPTQGNYAFVNVKTVPYTLIQNHANARLNQPWTLRDRNGTAIGSGTDVTSTGVYSQFRNETVLNCLRSVAESVGEHFRLDSGRNVLWLGSVSDFTNSNMMAVGLPGGHMLRDTTSNLAIIRDIERITDSFDITNVVFPFGAGDGDARLTMAAANAWPDGTTFTPGAGEVYHTLNGRYYALSGQGNYLIDTTSTINDGYGRYERSIGFPNIAPISNTDADLQNAANQLLLTTYNWMRTRYEPQEFYRISLVHTPQLLYPGQTIRVVSKRQRAGQQPIDVDATLNILSVTVDIDSDGLRTSELTVSTTDRYPESDERIQTQNIAEVRSMAAHPQMGASIHVITYRELFNDSVSATMPFWLGEEFAQVQSVVLYYTVTPLLSTVTATDAESSHTHQVTLSDHTHPIQIWDDDVPGTARLLYVDVATSPNQLVADVSSAASGRWIQLNTTAGGGGITTATAAGSAHSHAMQYGLFQENSSKTYSPTDVYIQVGSSGNLSGTATTISGWYKVDLTQYIIDTYTLRPSNSFFSVFVYPKSPSGKTGTVTAQLHIRSIISSVKYG